LHESGTPKEEKFSEEGSVTLVKQDLDTPIRADKPIELENAQVDKTMLPHQAEPLEPADLPDLKQVDASSTSIAVKPVSKEVFEEKSKQGPIPPYTEFEREVERLGKPNFLAKVFVHYPIHFCCI